MDKIEQPSPRGRKSKGLFTTNNFLRTLLLRKEVIQPHLPVRLPCYDLALLTSHTFDPLARVFGCS